MTADRRDQFDWPPSNTIEEMNPDDTYKFQRKRAKSDFSTFSRQPSPTKRSQNTFTLHIIKINQAGTDGTYSIWKDPECIFELSREKWDVPGTSGDSPLIPMHQSLTKMNGRQWQRSDRACQSNSWSADRTQVPAGLLARHDNFRDAGAALGGSNHIV